MVKEKTASELASLGGKARAKAMSAEERSESARRAVEARWAKAKGESVPAATHAGELRIGAATIPCAVLEDGTRVLTQEGFLGAIGRAKKAKGGQGAVGQDGAVDKLPAFLAAGNLKPFISLDLVESTRPIIFKPLEGGYRGGGYEGVAFGYRAELLPEVCRVYLAAKAAGKLDRRQERVAIQCEILLKGLENVGIIALVDEATKFQEVRPWDALTKYLELFVAKEIRKWVKTFPDEYYKHMYRLRGWEYSPDSSERTSAAANYTNDLIYDRIAPFVRRELLRVTPRLPSGRLKHHLHRRLTEDIGHPRLRDHMAGILALMRASESWEQFMVMVNRAYPRFDETALLALRYEDNDRQPSSGEADEKSAGVTSKENPAFPGPTAEDDRD